MFWATSHLRSTTTTTIVLPMAQYLMNGCKIRHPRCHLGIPNPFQIYQIGVSKNRGTPKSSIFMRFSLFSPSILGYPYFWEHPNTLLEGKSNPTYWILSLVKCPHEFVVVPISFNGCPFCLLFSWLVSCRDIKKHVEPPNLPDIFSQYFRTEEAKLGVRKDGVLV